MLFHTSVFAFFAIIVVVLFVILRGWPRKLMLLAASWTFYGWLDWRFLALMVISTSVDYALGLVVEKSEEIRLRRIMLYISVILNLAFLSLFKYYNFFVQNIHAALEAAGISFPLHLLHLGLPVGISFYTFQSMSYVFDIYRREIRATRNPIDYALFVSFFPHLVAGPIQRAKNLLPQLITLKTPCISDFVTGAQIFAVGLLYKVYMADNLAPLVDLVFSASHADGLSVVLASYCFGFQIYGDFAGYSLMAIGSSRVLGVHLTDNFRMPYLSSGPVEFWRRWHIALSTWFRDYLYIPLGGNRVSNLRLFTNLMTVMVLCGLWHGAGWNFIAWGVFHGLLIALDHIYEKSGWRIHALVRWAFWMNLIFIGWMLFRAQGAGQMQAMAASIFTDFRFSSYFGASSFVKALCIYALPIMAGEWLLKRAGKSYWFENMPMPLRIFGFTALLAICFVAGRFDARTFIYFAF